MMMDEDWNHLCCADCGAFMCGADHRPYTAPAPNVEELAEAAFSAGYRAASPTISSAEPASISSVERQEISAAFHFWNRRAALTA